MKYLAPLVIFGLVAALFFGMGSIGEAKPKPNLVTVAGEMKIWNWSINPAKYEYWHAGKEVARVTVTNYSDRAAEFDMGDGRFLLILGHSSLDYSYAVDLKKQTERFTITKVNEGSGIRVQEALVLKIEPKFGKKGGDVR